MIDLGHSDLLLCWMMDHAHAHTHIRTFSPWVISTDSTVNRSGELAAILDRVRSIITLYLQCYHHVCHVIFCPLFPCQGNRTWGSVFPSCSHRLDDASCKGAANPMCSTELWQHCIVDHLLPAASCPRPICVEANNYRSRSVTCINRDVLLLYSMKGAAVSWDVGDHSPSSPRTNLVK